MPQRVSHRGENIHKMEQVPEKRVMSRSQDLHAQSRGNMPPAQMKRLTHKTKLPAKKTSNKT